MTRLAKASSAGSKDATVRGRGFARLLGVLALATCACALIATPASAAPPTATIGSVSNILGGSAHVTGEIDPADSGESTYYCFEYSTDPVTLGWSGFCFAGPVLPQDGPTAVSRDITGLKGATKYFVRLVAANFEAPTVESTELEFETLPVDPTSVLAIDDASQVGFTAAKASGEVLRPTPANPDPAFDAKCNFEYITDAQYEENINVNALPGFTGATPVDCNHNPVKAADGPEVEAILTNLAPATTYHLRLSASNAGGSDSKVAANTFTTQAIANAPSLAVNPATEVKYSKALISGTVDPEGGNPNPVGDPVPILWELQYTRADEPASWQLAEAGTIEGAEAESSSPIAVPASPKQIEFLHSDTEYKFRLIASYAGLQEISSEGSLETEAATAPSATVEAATAITNHGAHFSGHVTPNGEDEAFNSSCEFQYVTQEQFDSNGFANSSSIGCQPEPPLKGTISIAVEADPANLEPGTVYHFRLRAENQAGPTTIVAASSFETEAIAPSLSGTAAHEVTATTATLNAQVNPGGDPTTFRFEYLTQAQYEADGKELTNAASTPETPVGEDTQNHLASAPIEGLQSDTIYVFRAVATNSKSASGGTPGPLRSFRTESSAPDSCSNAEVRTQQGSRYLPDCRAYELVSPANKHGHEAGANRIEGSKYSYATADGNGILYGAFGSFGDTQRGLQRVAFGHRQAGGWSSEDPALNHNPGKIGATSSDVASLLPSADLSGLVFQTAGTRNPPDNPDHREHSAAIYKATPATDSLEWLSRPQTPNPQPPPGNLTIGSFSVLGGSPDLSTVYFIGSYLLPLDPAHTGGGMIYRYSNGVLSDAATLPGGVQAPGGVAPASIAISAEGSGNQVSRDGSTLFFVSPDPGNGFVASLETQLYVNRDGHSTLVSHEPDGTPAPSGARAVQTLNSGEFRDPLVPRQYAYASADGNTAIFQSTDPLTPDAPNDSSIKSYRYIVKTNTVTYLPGVEGGTVLAASDDGSRFLFGRDGGDVRLWDEGTITTVTSSVLGRLAPARATPSGSAFVFSAFSLPGGFNGKGTYEVYRYDVAAKELACVSCPPDDVVPSGATLAKEFGTGDPIPPRGISADGNRVFFQTADPLVAGDTNGVLDVYEWTPTRTSLISSGHGVDPSYLLDISASGDDAFFATTESLESADADGGYDVYDARVGGGFLKREVTPCAGEECLEGPSSPPAAATAASENLIGAGNPKSCPKGKVRKHGECVKQRARKKHHKKQSHKRASHKRGGAK